MYILMFHGVLLLIFYCLSNKKKDKVISNLYHLHMTCISYITYMLYTHYISHIHMIYHILILYMYVCVGDRKHNSYLNRENINIL